MIDVNSFKTIIYFQLITARRRTIVRKLHRAIRNRKLKELVRIFGEYKATQPPKSDELLRDARRIINQLKAKDSKLKYQ